MPLGHSESLADHELNLAKYSQTVWDLRQSNFKDFHPSMSFGLSHHITFYRVIEKFGRFPNRNEVLGRESTEEEKKFLEGGWKFELPEEMNMRK